MRSLFLVIIYTHGCLSIPMEAIGLTGVFKTARPFEGAPEMAKSAPLAGVTVPDQRIIPTQSDQARKALSMHTEEFRPTSTFPRTGPEPEAQDAKLPKNFNPQDLGTPSSVHTPALIPKIAAEDTKTRGGVGLSPVRVWEALVGPKGISDPLIRKVATKYSNFMQRYPGSLIKSRGDVGKSLAIYLDEKHANINPLLVEKYFDGISGADISSHAIVKTSPKIKELRNHVNYGILRRFFLDRLKQSEIERRESVLSLQDKQVSIVKDWDAEIVAISKEQGFDSKEIRRAGEILGVTEYFPSFKNGKKLQNLQQVNKLQKENPNVFRALEDYLGHDELISRIKLMRTISTMKYQGITSKEISGWLEQGLDVQRMLKITEMLHRVRTNQVKGILSDVMGKEELAMNSIFRPVSPKIPWFQSLERHKLLESLSSDPKLKELYFNLEVYVEEHSKQLDTLSHPESVIDQHIRAALRGNPDKKNLASQLRSPYNAKKSTELPRTEVRKVTYIDG
ncbi:hypothetical protein PGT21_035288 [Puccinia graminis f. sp. tritici]|uniref:RxLR effector candidate protein n=1 Tax=Puccinia graminis f. sp. tritici TaxID=56615 RepID=A0A5B0MND2_PUCGR|nr:hypothetical protein PGT21_035288 [Puccinia graminis f. sp. tritici]